MEKNGPAQSFRSMSSRPLKETLVLALSAFFVYTSFHALKALQSSLNQQQGLGVVSLACVYISLFVSSFLTPVIIHKGGVKPVIVAAWVCQCLYVVCNFYPHWATLIPGSVLVGFANCPWWTSLMIYLAALADVTVSMETEKKTTLQVAFSRLNGIYSAFFVASGFLGGVLSSVILFQFSDYEFSSVNVSLAENTECGAGYCFREASGQDLPRPEHAVLNVLLLCFLVMDLIGLLITVAFLPDLQRADEPCGYDIKRKLKAYWTAFRDPKILLFVPVVISNTLNYSLRITLFTEAYISCAVGIKMVGYVVAAWGLSTTLFSGGMGLAVRFTGRQLQMALAILADTAILVIYLLWRPQEDHLETFFMIAAMMGLADGIWMVQMNSLVACLFQQNTESALAVKATWSSLVLASAFIMATFLCPRPRIVVALVFAGVGACCYIMLEVWEKHTPVTEHRLGNKKGVSYRACDDSCSSN